MTTRHRRRAHDFYPTPAWATRILLREWPAITGHGVLEPCHGQGAITDELRAIGRCRVETNDLLAIPGADFQLDATAPASWRRFSLSDWVITNPPFSHAFPILQHAYAYTRGGRGVAFLLRLSFLEPTRDRRAFLVAHPPEGVLVLPRISFTGDGKTDNVTAAWFIWDRQEVAQQIRIIPPVEWRPASDRPLFREAEAPA